MEYKDMKTEHKLGRKRGEFQKTRFDDDVPVGNFSSLSVK